MEGSEVGMTGLMLPLEHHDHATPCPACRGRGVTGERYEMAVTGHVLLLEVFCPACGGCGNGDPDHTGCEPRWHPYPDDDSRYSVPDYLDDPGDEARGACLSCVQDRGWWPAQGFNGEGADTEMHTLRCPCGCSESRLVPAKADAP